MLLETISPAGLQPCPKYLQIGFLQLPVILKEPEGGVLPTGNAPARHVPEGRAGSVDAHPRCPATDMEGQLGTREFLSIYPVNVPGFL